MRKVKQPKAKRYLFIGGPNDRNRIPVYHAEAMYVYSAITIDTDTSILFPTPEEIDKVFHRHLYHLESITVDGVTTEAYIYDDLWKDRAKMFAHLISNYGKPKKYQRPKPKMSWSPPASMLQSKIVMYPMWDINGAISP